MDDKEIIQEARKRLVGTYSKLTKVYDLLNEAVRKAPAETESIFLVKEALAILGIPGKR